MPGHVFSATICELVLQRLKSELTTFFVGVENLHYPEWAYMHIGCATCDHCCTFNNVQIKACYHLIICILFQSGNENAKGNPPKFIQAYLRQKNISLLRLLSVEQKGVFTALSVHRGGRSKIYSNYSGSLNGRKVEAFWST